MHASSKTRELRCVFAVEGDVEPVRCHHQQATRTHTFRVAVVVPLVGGLQESPDGATTTARLRRCSMGEGVVAPRMDNVGIVVEDLDGAIAFFGELGLELVGRTLVEGEWAGRVTGLGDQRVEVAMLRTPDGHGQVELSRFLAPEVVEDNRRAPVNALGYLRVMFTVDDLNDTLSRLEHHGAELVSTDVVQYEEAYRLCYVRGPEGILVGLAQALT